MIYSYSVYRTSDSLMILSYRPPSGGLLIPGQVTIPQGVRLPSPVMSGTITMPPPGPPSSVTSSQDTPPPRFPPTQPGAHDCWLIMVG